VVVELADAWTLLVASMRFELDGFGPAERGFHRVNVDVFASQFSPYCDSGRLLF